MVCIHGMTIPSEMFQPLSRSLTDAGFQVLIFDLYGRGLSDAPFNVEYSDSLFVQQVQDLLSALSLEDKKLAVIGFSMGGGIAAAFTAANMDKG